MDSPLFFRALSIMEFHNILYINQLYQHCVSGPTYW